MRVRQPEHNPITTLHPLPSVLPRSAISTILIVSAQHHLLVNISFPSMGNNWKSQVTLRQDHEMAAMKDVLQLVPRSAPSRSHKEAALLYRATLIILKGGRVLLVCRRQLENRIQYHSPRTKQWEKVIYLYITSTMCIHQLSWSNFVCCVNIYLNHHIPTCFDTIVSSSDSL